MLAFIFAAALAASSTAPADAERAGIERAQSLIAVKLKDPEAARFKDVEFNPETGVACGQVNTKNSFGGYVGYQDFIVKGDFALTRGEAAASLQPLFDEGWKQCKQPRTTTPPAT